MTRKKKAVEPHGPHGLSLKVDGDMGDMLNEMAKVTGIAKSSIIRNSLYETLAKWEQSRGAK